MQTKTSYFIKICYNLDEYIEYVDSLTDDDVKIKLISAIEKDDKIILIFKEVYTEI